MTEPGADVLRLELTILGGPHKGEMVQVRATGLGVDELVCLGTPVTLTVTDSSPVVELDRY